MHVPLSLSWSISNVSKQLSLNKNVASYPLSFLPQPIFVSCSIFAWPRVSRLHLVLWLPSLPRCRVSLISSSADLMSPFSYAIFLHSSFSVNLLLVFLQTHRPVFSHSHASTGAVLMLVCPGAAFFDYIFYSFVLDHCTELSEVTLIFFPSHV